MYALVMNRTDAATWDRGMVVEFRPDTMPLTRPTLLGRFLAVQLPEDLPQAVQYEWVESRQGVKSGNNFIPIVTPTGSSIVLSRRKKKLNLDTLLQGRSLVDGRLHVTLQEMRDHTVEVTRYKIVDGESRTSVPWLLGSKAGAKYG